MHLLMRTLIIATAHAQDFGPPPGACDTFWGTDASNHSGGFGIPGGGFACLAELAPKIVYTVIGFTASIALIMLMVNGFRYMLGPAMPGGSSDAAKKGITAALIGIAVSLLVYAITDTIVYYLTS